VFSTDALVPRLGKRFVLAAISLAVILAACGGSSQSRTAKTLIASTSATETAIPKQLTGDWSQNQFRGISVSPRGEVEISDFRVYHARFSRVTKHRLSISGGTLPGPPLRASCSGTGTYRWTILNHGDVTGEAGHELKLTKIHDTCKRRVGQFAGIWFGT
jgi:hypothetical protein